MRKVVVTLILLAGCASSSYQSELDAWIGLPIDDVVAAWGVPDTVEGNTYTWRKTRSMYVGGQNSFVRECRTTLLVDRQGRVVDGSWRGGC